jgi:hypothetical protein
MQTNQPQKVLPQIVVALSSRGCSGRLIHASQEFLESLATRIEEEKRLGVLLGEIGRG